MTAPIHSINIDLSHSTEAKALLQIISDRFSPVPGSEIFLGIVEAQLLEAIELLENFEE